jgi:hypothetical protein
LLLFAVQSAVADDNQIAYASSLYSFKIQELQDPVVHLIVFQNHLFVDFHSVQSAGPKWTKGNKYALNS